MKRHCFALDLKDDERLIAEYEAHHLQVWPEVLACIKDCGITSMEIYRVGNRLFMIMKVDEEFSVERKAKADQNEKVKAWEQLMWKYQQALPFAKSDEKWAAMKRIFSSTNIE